jgi:hypothetical protein
MTDDEDGRDDSSMLSSPYFWLVAFIGLCIWGVVIWAWLS